MNLIIKIIGIVFVVIAIVFLLKPDVPKRMMEFFKKGKRIYLAGLIRLVLAIVFLLGASECRRFWVIFTLGVLFLISGLLVFTMGTERCKSYISWWQKRSVLLLRVTVLIPLAIGAVIIYST